MWVVLLLIDYNRIVFLALTDDNDDDNEQPQRGTGIVISPTPSDPLLTEILSSLQTITRCNKEYYVT